MHGVIMEANGSYLRGCAYTIWATKADRLIMQSTKHICSTSMSTEQYLHGQIQKAVWWLEDIYMQTVPVEQIRPPTQCAVCNRMETTHYKDPVDKGMEERDIVCPTIWW